VTVAAVGPIQLEVDGQGEPVVFVHGLGGTSNTFAAMLESFAGFRCIRPDLPGSGGVEWH
jgi:3-oxoadipate enol-lactonase